MIELVNYSNKHIDSLINLLNNKNVSDWLVMVPYPYTKKDAKWWINHCKDAKNNKRDFLYAIENEEEHVGGISLHKKFEHSAELGYWLGEPYWSKGYMFEAINNIIEFAFEDLKLIRVFAYVFEENIKSENVLLKTGFLYEGLLKKCHKKGNKIFNSKVYAKVI
ncbi:GNAT family N-acetyltransferase [Bacteroidota bacterium]